MQLKNAFFSMASICLLAGCTPPPAVTQSREALWQKYGGQSVDQLLIEWGTPLRESRMTDGSRLVTYQHATLFDAATPYERQSSCEVTFMAQAPKYRISNVAMEGEARECQLLSQGRTGTARHVRMPEAAPYYSKPFRYPF